LSAAAIAARLDNPQLFSFSWIGGDDDRHDQQQDQSELDEYRRHGITAGCRAALTAPPALLP
jgi:hypothetical protein